MVHCVRRTGKVAKSPDTCTATVHFSIVFIVVSVFIQCSDAMDSDGEKAIGESYWSCYRRSRNKTEADMQLLSTQLYERVGEESVYVSDEVNNSDVTQHTA